MEQQINLLLWIISAGFGLNFAMLAFIWNKIEKLDEKVTDMDRRLCRLEGAFSMQQGCAIINERSVKKAE